MHKSADSISPVDRTAVGNRGTKPVIKRQRALGTVDIENSQQDSEAVAPGVEFRSGPRRSRAIGRHDFIDRQAKLKRMYRELCFNFEPARQNRKRFYEASRKYPIARQRIFDRGAENERDKRG